MLCSRFCEKLLEIDKEPLLSVTCAQLNDLHDVVGLYPCVVCRAAPFYFTALAAFMHDYISAFCVCFDADRIHYPAASVSPVTGIHIHMQ